MRFLFLLFVVLAIDLYAFQAFRVIFHGWSAKAKWGVTIIYWAIPVYALALMLLTQWTNIPQTNKTLFVTLQTLAFIVYFSKFMILPIILIDDLRRLVVAMSGKWNGNPAVDLARSKFLAHLGVLAGSIPFISLTYGLRNPYRYKLYQETISIEHLPTALDGLKIVQISDIHAGSLTFREPVFRAIELINKAEADLVFFTGDLVNNVSDEMDNFIEVFNKIRASIGVYSVLGNHDYGDYATWSSREAKQANLDKMKRIHKEMGWDLLLNENRLIDINGQAVAVIGVENYSAMDRFPKYGDLHKAHQGTEKAALKLLLSHDPTHWDAQINKLFSDIDITFSGHTHGFQFGVEIPGFKWSPAQFIFKQWAGLYQQGKQFLYVNRGLGFIKYPGRVGILPEIALIELRKA